MIRQWKRCVPLVLSGGLIACSTLPVQDSKLETTEGAETITHPQLEMPAPVALKQPSLKKRIPVPQYRMMGDGKLILGQREWVLLPGIDMVFKARIEPDDEISSLNVAGTQYFQRNGQHWVAFRVVFHGRESDTISLPIAYWMTDKQSGTKQSKRRAVVMTWIEVGEVKELTEFALDNRSHLSYPVLLGHRFLKDLAVVDLSREYIQKKPLSPIKSLSPIKPLSPIKSLVQAKPLAGKQLPAK